MENTHRISREMRAVNMSMKKMLIWYALRFGTKLRNKITEKNYKKNNIDGFGRIFGIFTKNVP